MWHRSTKHTASTDGGGGRNAQVLHFEEETHLVREGNTVTVDKGKHLQSNTT